MEGKRDARATLPSRRTMLKVGMGLAAVAAGGRYFGSGDVLAAMPGPSSEAVRSFPLIAEVVGVTDLGLALRTTAGQSLSAVTYGFPREFNPRVGDLVGIAVRDSAGRPVPPMPNGQLTSASPLCAPMSSPTNAGGPQFSAVPLSSWRRGVPAINQYGKLRIEGVSLVESAAVREAATRGQEITIYTLDSTLDTLQVLGTRA
jgi:hypothetical protein